jgi:NADPH:quinone reductase-like Zn-dependent oxidoreductase
VAGPGEIVVRVHACALNPLDIFTREGCLESRRLSPTSPAATSPGWSTRSGPGRVPRVGDRIVLNPSWGCGVCEYCRDGEVPKCIRVHMLGEMDPGGLAEYVKCPRRQAIPLPASYPFEEAACLPITFGTAWRMLVTHARVRAGEDVLVHGAVGGVGLAAIQIAKLAGARVFATASTADKLERATALGADVAINYAEDKEWDVTVRRLTGKRGVDVIVETVGAAVWERSIRALGKGGRSSPPARRRDPSATDIRYLFRREHTIQGSNGWTHNDLLTIMRLAFEGSCARIDRPCSRSSGRRRASGRWSAARSSARS